MELPNVIIMPKGVKDISDVFASKGFKSFLKKESQKPKQKQKLSLNLTTCSGTGRSFLNEYLQTLPTIKFDKLATSKKALGRLVMILDISEYFNKQIETQLKSRRRTTKKLKPNKK
jgi:hypothetical protein